LQNSFSARGLQTLLFTKVYGYYKDKQNLTVGQELEYDREHWFGHYGLKPLKIGVVETAVIQDTANPGSTRREKAKYQLDYRVMFIPTVFVIDREGIIRYATIGFSEKAVRRKIEELTAAKGTK
jgi:hypothetical protein